MRLPGRLLSQLRVGVSASAVLVAGCDLAAADSAPEATVSEPASHGESEAPQLLRWEGTK